MSISKLCIAATITLSLTTSPGCGSLARRETADQSQPSFFGSLPWKRAKQEPPEPYPNPVKVAATWTPDTLVQTGRTPTRGFGGRVFFYDQKSRPVPVDGTLIVHGFDDTAAANEQRVKRFEFTPDQFTRHFSQSELGASYSVWIPWDAIGGPQRRISLVTSFRTAEGKTVQGIPATVLLPGPTDSASEKVTKLSPQYERYLAATRSGSTPRTGLTTTTITKRNGLANASPQPSQALVARALANRSMTAGHTTRSAEVPRRASKHGSAVIPASAKLPAE